MRHNLLADAFCIIKNAESIGRVECVIPASNLIRDVLKVMERAGYIEKFEHIEDGKGGKFRVKLLRKINNCNVIKPNYSIKKDELIRFEKRFLPATGIGILILTTSKGVMEQKQALKEGVGGRLLGYVY
jgi:small subunit ribosomal protein S8